MSSKVSKENISFSKRISREDDEKLVSKIFYGLITAFDHPLRSDFIKIFRNDRSLFVTKDWPNFLEGTSLINNLIYRQILALFQKDESISIDIDREEVAYSSFMKSEITCFLTNQRLSRPNPRSLHFEALISRAGDIISRILGPVPSYRELCGGFGSGGSIDTKTTNTVSKLMRNPYCCSVPYDTLYRFFSSDRVYEASSYRELAYLISNTRYSAARLAFVPKNAKTYRSILIEPLLNTYVQKGIGTKIRQCLFNTGINLNDQEKNKVVARESSVTGRYVTIDLSAASDSISFMIVNRLLPSRWFELLSSWRSSCYAYKKGAVRNNQLHKFSSMGNGYTFELESLIFFGLGQAVRECYGYFTLDDFHVYGDDIVIETECYELLRDLFVFCGFTINEKKSCINGPFRESCGGDYLFGHDIRPFYRRNRFTIQDLYTMYNFFFRSHAQYAGFPGSIMNIIGGFLRHKHAAFFGPVSDSDSWLLSDEYPVEEKYNKQFQRRVKSIYGFLPEVYRELDVDIPFSDNKPSWLNRRSRLNLFRKRLGRYYSNRETPSFDEELRRVLYSVRVNKGKYEFEAEALEYRAARSPYGVRYRLSKITL